MGCREREVNFYSDGNKIAALLFEPDPQERPGPGVVLCQGLNGVGRNYRFPRTARTFAEAGYTSLVFDHRGFGESEGTRDRLWPEEQVDDIRSGLSFLETLPSVDSERLGLWGASGGGSNVVQAAALDPRVRCVISLVGIGNGERWLRGLWPYWRWRNLLQRLEADRRRRAVDGRSEVVSLNDVVAPDPITEEMRQRSQELSPDLKAPYSTSRLSLESAEKLMAFRPEEVVDRISPRPILLVHTRDDILVPADETRSMYERAGEPKKLVILPGNHFSIYMPPLYEQVTQLSLDWLREHLPA